MVPSPVLTERSADGLLLVGHGSRSATGAAELLTLGELVARATGEMPVETGFLELCEPRAGVVLDRLVDRGARRVAVVPLMLNAAGHAKSDVPAVVLDGRARHPTVTLRYGRALGIDHTTVALARQRILHAGGEGVPLLVVARGTSEPEANADGARVARLLAEMCGAPLVVTGYSGLTWPLVPDALEHCRRLGAEVVVQLAWYLCTGVLVERMREEAATWSAATGIPVRWAGHLGPDPALVPLVLSRAAEALEGAVHMSCDVCSYRAPFPGVEDRVDHRLTRPTPTADPHPTGTGRTRRRPSPPGGPDPCRRHGHPRAASTVAPGSGLMIGARGPITIAGRLTDEGSGGAMHHSTLIRIGGLVIGQSWEDTTAGPVLRVVVIDPELHSVEAEDIAGGVVLDDIEHFTATHRALDWPLAG